MISICMAYYNRREQLQVTLDSYEKWYADLDLEIVICDDGSDEVLEFDTPFKSRILHLAKSKPLNPCVPLNRAVEASSGHLIVITSPEIEHRHAALYDMLWRWNDEKDCITATCFDDRRGVLASQDMQHAFPVPEGANFHFCVLMHRNLFPGYDEDYRFGQAFDDNDILWRLKERNANFVTSDIPVYHNHSPVQWKLPLNDKLFAEKWPEARRRALGG